MYGKKPEFGPPPRLEMEARLKDFMSGDLDKIRATVEQIKALGASTFKGVGGNARDALGVVSALTNGQKQSVVEAGKAAQVEEKTLSTFETAAEKRVVVYIHENRERIVHERRYATERIKYENEVITHVRKNHEQMVRLNERKKKDIDEYYTHAGNVAVASYNRTATLKTAEADVNQKYEEKFAADSLKTLGLIGAATKAGAEERKAIAIIQSVISTALSVARSLEVGVPWGVPLAIAAGALGAAQTAIIAQQKFQRGGMVQGGSLSGDGVPIRANAGEVVFTNQQAARMFNVLEGGTRTNNNSNVTINLSVPANANAATVASIDASLRDFGKKLEDASRRGYVKWNNVRI